MKARVVVAAVVENEGMILLGKKPDNVGPYPNTWHLPGGGIRLGEESLEEAIIREVKEETGLDIMIEEKVSFDDGYEPDKQGEMTHYIFLVFRVRASTHIISAGDDIVKVKWFKRTEIKDLALPKPTIKIFHKLGLL